jgi:hypothetical protein
MADQLKMALQDLLRKAELERDAMFCAWASGCWPRRAQSSGSPAPGRCAARAGARLGASRVMR